MQVFSTIEYASHLSTIHYSTAAQLYEQAFGPKMKVAISARTHRLAIFNAAMNGDYAVCAIDNNVLVGLAGFHTSSGSLTGGVGANYLVKKLGYVKGLRAIVVLMFYERKLKDNELLMDGISVDGNFRGQGIGTQLLKLVIDYAQNNNYRSVRLDVIDINNNAKRLYENIGFKVTKTEKFEFLRSLFGFGAVTTMEYQL